MPVAGAYEQEGRLSHVAASIGALPTDPAASTRTLLELVAELMEESFAVVGEGHILGTMPAYLERFGAGNARYVSKTFLGQGEVKGPEGALSPMDLISRVTGTEYSTHKTEAGTIKRLHSCEFLDAFESRGEFPRAMMCMLHRAAYQGSVNGLVDKEHGFDVQLNKRILFGDASCDFLVVPRSDVPQGDTALPVINEPQATERADLAYNFYTFLLTSFVDYLTHQLPDERVEEMLRVVAARVGTKVGNIITAAFGEMDSENLSKGVLRMAGRTLEGDTLKVTACPQAAHIVSTASGVDEADRLKVVANACRLCKHVVTGAVEADGDGGRVTRSKSLAMGDDHCDFEVARD